MIKNINIILFTFIFLTSCSNYISKIYKQIDREERIKRKKSSDVFSRFRDSKSGKPISTNETSKLRPKVKRSYKGNPNAKRRYKSSDLNDNSNNSLWVGEGKDSDFFIEIKKKKYGDIVIINILSSFKNKITRELKKAFPKRKKPSLKTENKDGKAGAETKEPVAANKNKEDDPKIGDALDQISSVVTERISKTHLLIRGRKEVLFRRRKRLVEVQALVARKDISIEDKVESDKFIESSVRIIR